MIRVVAFDLFGTVFDASGVPADERRDYVRHVRKNAVDWLPLSLPESWKTMPVHPDSVEGIAAIRAKGIKVVTLTNWPREQIEAASNNAGIVWDRLVLLERYRIYKPHLSAYAAVCEELKTAPWEVLMVTANPGAGDDTTPLVLGMATQVIRGFSAVKDIIELAKKLEAAK